MIADKQFVNDLDGISERREYGLTVLSPIGRRPRRRVIFVNNYGGASVWRQIKAGEMAAHHLWGCIELVKMGYEIGLAEPIPDFNPRRPFPHDLKLVNPVRGWLGKDDIVYCGHNVLYWVPFLRSLGLTRRHVVSLLFAREPLDFPGAHCAVVALTPVAAKQARLLAPKARIAHLGWGVNVEAYPRHSYSPNYLLHCGIAGRDFKTLNHATARCAHPIRFIAPGLPHGLIWPANVEVINSGRGYNHEKKKVSFSELLHDHYAKSAASIIVTLADPRNEHALGFTNLIEALAMSQPIIQTRTGSLVHEIDVEKAGCGLTVPPEDPVALAAAMNVIMEDPARAAAMGKVSRRLSETHYNIGRYTHQLHALFESL